MFIRHLLRRAAPVLTYLPFRTSHSTKKAEVAAQTVEAIISKPKKEDPKQSESKISFKLLADVLGKKVPHFLTLFSIIYTMKKSNFQTHIQSASTTAPTA